ncbi:MAG TPA: beta-L-arabinofuranosidase domain-containing protein [Tepidisphaeraceae bacterium]|nr:beta-L-arabinofuranosidase domain-containing protein [Tepidisphaeraceae bacterium]
MSAKHLITLIVSSTIAVLAATTQAVPYHGVFTEAAPTSIQPQGWLAEILHRQVTGLATHHAASGYPYDTCLWTGKIGKGGDSPYWKPWWPYEQTGYLVDGLERLGLLTNDPQVSAEAAANIRYILDHPAADGSLGPDHIGPTNWPHAVVFRAIEAAYAAHPDPAIPEALRRHYLSRPADYGIGRDVCNVESILWTYAHTGDERLLTLAQRTYDNFNHTKAATTLPSLANARKIVEHGVTFNETAKLPALLYLYTGDRALLDATVNAYEKIDRDHMLASGMHSAEERLDGQDAWGYTEVCDISDYTWSVGYLLMSTGDATWADHIERAVFNAGLGAITKDFKAHQYFSSPNQVVATNGICKRYNPNRLAYRAGHDVQCCSGNVERFLPNYALRQWMQNADGGVAAVMYGPSRFSTTIDGQAVTIDEQTDYPFSETITFVVHVAKPAAFGLSLRLPGWTKNPSVAVNDQPLTNAEQPGQFTTIRRTFNDGDKIVLKLPMPIVIHHWPHDTASIERGPLVFSLKIGESATPVQDATMQPGFPAWDKRPASPWNCALAISDGGSEQLQLVSKPTNGFPFDIGHSPIELQAPARVITNWKLTDNGGNPGFPTSPQLADEVERVTLVPYGSTCLRLTVFPTVAPTERTVGAMR